MVDSSSIACGTKIRRPTTRAGDSGAVPRRGVYLLPHRALDEHRHEVADPTAVELGIATLDSQQDLLLAELRKLLGQPVNQVIHRGFFRSRPSDSLLDGVGHRHPQSAICTWPGRILADGVRL